MDYFFTDEQKQIQRNVIALELIKEAAAKKR